MITFGLVGASYRFSKSISNLIRALENFCFPYLDDMVTPFSLVGASYLFSKFISKLIRALKVIVFLI